MDPNYLFALHCLQFALTMKKDPEAIAVAKKFLELTSGDVYVLSLLGWTYGVLGNQKEAEGVLKRLNELSGTTAIPAPAMFYMYLGLGDRDQTFKYMEQTYRERWNDVVFIKTPPHLDVLRPDPRFVALIEKMRLTQ
jgi:hypothetical protein